MRIFTIFLLLAVSGCTTMSGRTYTAGEYFSEMFTGIGQARAGHFRVWRTNRVWRER